MFLRLNILELTLAVLNSCWCSCPYMFYVLTFTFDPEAFQETPIL